MRARQAKKIMAARVELPDSNGILMWPMDNVYRQRTLNAAWWAMSWSRYDRRLKRRRAKRLKARQTSD